MDAHVARRAGHRPHGPRGGERGRRVDALSADRRTLAAVRRGTPSPLDRTGVVPGHRRAQRASGPRDHGVERQRRPRARGRPRPGGRAARRDLRPDPRARHAPRATCSSWTSEARASPSPLTCPALSTPSARSSLLEAGARCAGQLGAKRGLFRTADSVADIEALREQAGYARLTIFAVSYGTKVALAYAAAHPDRVERLVLDSVVTPDGPDVLQHSTFAAVPRVLGELCAGNACQGITDEPDRRADVARQAAGEAPDPRPLRGQSRAPARGRRSPARTSSPCCSRATRTRRCAPRSRPRSAHCAAATAGRSGASSPTPAAA